MNLALLFKNFVRSVIAIILYSVLALTSPQAGADTIVNIDFDDDTDLQSLFNPDSSTFVFNRATGGLGNSGTVNSAGGQNSGDIWTSKIGYSVNGAGDTYRLSSFFRLSDSRGHSGLGISTNNVNEPLGSGYSASGIGYIATDEVITIVSSVTANPTPQTFETRLSEFEILFPGSWYHFEVTIITKSQSSYDVSVAISESDSNGTIGSVVTIVSESEIVNSDLGQAAKIHPYFSINATSGSRFDRVDDLGMRLSGGPVVVPDPEADSDNDGELDSVDEDDDDDGTNDEFDSFPLDENESRDSDNDGIGDEQDTDDDNDGVEDEFDAFPTDPTQTTDTDGDGVGDGFDAFPTDPSETTDSDNDGVGDNADAYPNDPSRSELSSSDTDSDGDGVNDDIDAFPDNPQETMDSDNDGLGDNADAFPNDPAEQYDSDSDGLGDNADVFPNDPAEQYDSDSDGLGDNADVFPNDPAEQYDSDNDGLGDNADVFPNDPAEQYDSDSDGLGDNEDAFPNDAAEKFDSDSDGVGDNADAFPDNPAEQLDTDNDGLGDNADAFPNDPAEQLDSDNDGIGDNADPTPFGEVPTNGSDTDNDGVADSLDAFPEDASEWLDSDEDGIGNNADAFDFDPNETVDTDNDGTGDNADVFPSDASEQIDSDGDGIGDNSDPDNDNDGTPDTEDTFPLDANEQMDTDGDGIGDRADRDDDGDGVADATDAFPLIATESLDTDGDGLGNNSDDDDDNDGIPDNADLFPLDAEESIDTDNDGVGDNRDIDDDNDGYVDVIELSNGSDPVDPASLPEGLDIDRDTLADSLERGSDADGDGIGNEFDVDSDNDGIFDLLEASAYPSLAALLDLNNDGMMDQLDVRGLTRISIPVDTDGDAIRDYRDLDSDNDGLSDTAETTPLNSNFLTNNSLQNDQSLRVLADPDNDRLVNYRDLDSDNDGIPDIVEAGGEDQDNDGLADEFLDINADGMDDAYFAVPLLPRDSDNDGEQDYVDLDSDNDGRFDLVAIGLIDADLNGDGRLDIATDSDDDGILDYADVTITQGVDSDADGIDDRVDASILDELDTDLDGVADNYDADSQGDGFIQIARITLPENNMPVVIEPIVIAPVTSPTVPPVTIPTVPEESTPPLGSAVATTSIGTGGCSISSSGQPDITLAALLIFSAIYLTLVKVGTLRTLKSTLLVFLSTSLAAGPTLADVQTGLYLGLGGGTSRLMPGIENAQLDSRESTGVTWNATAGYQLNRMLGVEFEHINLGTTKLAPLGSIDYQSQNISGLYHLGGIANRNDGRKFSLYTKLGVGTISNQSNIQLQKDTGSHWLAGLGVQMPLSDQLSLRAEGVYYAEDVSRAGLTLTYRMGGPAMPSMGPYVQSVTNTFKNLAQRVSGDHTDEPADGARENLQAQSSRYADNNKPLVLSADQHNTQPTNILDIDALMATEPNPAKPWTLSKKDIQQMYGKTEKPSIASAMPVSSLDTLPENATSPVQFNFDSLDILKEYQTRLKSLVKYLSATPDATVTLTGHTDSVGDEKYNQTLSLRRAEAVRKFLLQQGIDRKMIRILGAGEKRPVKSNATPAGRKANRRVSIVVN